MAVSRLARRAALVTAVRLQPRLLLAPGALYLRHRFRDDPLIDLYTIAALAYMLIGAMGAVIFATAAPPLMRAYPSASLAQRESIVTTFTTVHTIVFFGLWMTLEAIPAAVWLLGIGTNLYRARRRALALVLLALGGLFLLAVAGRMLGL